MSFPSLKRDSDVSPFVSNKCEFDLAGVVLKMARLIKDGTVKGGKSEAVEDALRKPPLKSYIIVGKDFVQIVAKVSSGLMASGIQVFLHLNLPSFTRSF
jgi:hypothetical protein